MIFRKVLFVLFLLALSSCGGGSAGTGGQRFEGRLLSDAGISVPDALVTIGESGGSSRTDQQGVFVIDTKLAVNSAKLFVEGVFQGASFSGSVDIIDIPPSKEVTVTVTLELETETNTVKLKEVNSSSASSSSKPSSSSVASSHNPNTGGNTSSQSSDIASSDSSSSNAASQSSNSDSSSSSASSSSSTASLSPTPTPTFTPRPPTNRYRGMLRHAGSNAPFKNATVRVLETDAFGFTDDSGTFDFCGPPRPGTITILVAAESGEEDFETLSGVPSGPVQANLDIEGSLSQVGLSINIISSSFALQVSQCN